MYVLEQELWHICPLKMNNMHTIVQQWISYIDARPDTLHRHHIIQYPKGLIKIYYQMTDLSYCITVNFATSRIVLYILCTL